MRMGFSVRRRAYESIGVGMLAAVLIFACTFVRPSWDMSESRSNSFSEPDERALKSIHGPLSIEVHLATEDPRRVDLQNRALSKLQRLMPGLRVRYVSATSIGLFEQSNAGYGEIWYDLAGSRTMSRSTTAEGVLEAIYSLAHLTPPVVSDNDMFRGHPLAAPSQGAATIFYALWPGIFLASATLARRRLK
jgi:hypothetical protein